jgi:hypothetical protein
MERFTGSVPESMLAVNPAGFGPLDPSTPRGSIKMNLAVEVRAHDHSLPQTPKAFLTHFQSDKNWRAHVVTIDYLNKDTLPMLTVDQVMHTLRELQTLSFAVAGPHLLLIFFLGSE